ncbi:hypothetical protein Trydic_g11721 [Trypoxylus dichotomus]
MANMCKCHASSAALPSQWKQADVVMIPKPGQSANWPQNYRPISLLPVMGKIADRIILTRPKEETDDADVIPNCQFGFRRGHSTSHQVLHIVEQIKEGFNLREYTGAVLLDVAEAFDKVWHQGLLLKMYWAGIPKAMVRVVDSYLRKRAFKVKLEGIYTSDILAIAHVNLTMYADDVCIFARSRAGRSLHPKNSHPIIRPSGGPMESPRVGVSGLRLQDLVEVRSPTVTHRGPPGLTAEHPAC